MEQKPGQGLNKVLTYPLFKITIVHKKERSTLLLTANRCMQDAHTYFLA